MSINLSAVQLRDPLLADHLRSVLEETNLPAESLALEITESTIIENTESASALLSDLKDIGVQLHVDDFGTGFSSLDVLHRFPVDTIKIDRSFVDGLSINKRTLEIVRAIVNLGQNLDKKIIAEGIEKERDYVCLRELRCDMGQGFFLWRGLTEAQATELLGSTPIPHVKERQHLSVA